MQKVSHVLSWRPFYREMRTRLRQDPEGTTLSLVRKLAICPLHQAAWVALQDKAVQALKARGRNVNGLVW
jgi:hypothetical protein